MILLKNGSVAAEGKPADVLTNDNIKQVFECTMPNTPKPEINSDILI
jgi:ABC-type hemin transport system ATPase subunit